MAFDKNHTSLFMKIVIIFFAVVLVVSLCLPFFSGCTQRFNSTSGDDAQDSAQNDSTSSNTVSGVEAQYSTLISSLTEKLEGDPDSLAYLANLGNAYMNSGLAMMAASDADSFAEKVEASFASAVGYYDRYLAQFRGITVGVCYLGCIQWNLPHGYYDRPVDILITEKYVRRIARQEDTP